ncbi:hypothetical protein SLEP1_g58055 [Rubroshorea leprosula]|uniref:Secreted protein n=1 Tax=Rubroshorea leprosula TaxID=152421 RepID=A0AAV5MRC5_9ROSI|nr:hypothetical protein SLEP1_g58055 [Rubroshorea leprosula]
MVKKQKLKSSLLAWGGLILAILSGENSTVNLSAPCPSNEEISVNRSGKLADMGGAEDFLGRRSGACRVVHTAGPSTGVATPPLQCSVSS